VIDNRWREHLFDMDYLREGIHLRGFAQIDPLVAYKNEGFTMFHELMNSIWEEFARVIYHVEVNVEPADFEPGPEAAPSELQYAGGGPEQPSAIQQAASESTTATSSPVPGVLPATPSGGGTGIGGAVENPETVVKTDRDKIGRNDPCWCGSGKKYKKCHGA
jgi:preprotein translocase subunit SecA